jgi:hypothetical protein
MDQTKDQDKLQKQSKQSEIIHETILAQCNLASEPNALSFSFHDKLTELRQQSNLRWDCTSELIRDIRDPITRKI